MEIKTIKKGFTLIEMIIVVIIIGILVGMIINSIGKQIKTAQMYADMKTADRINSLICPVYLTSFLKNNNWNNSEEIMNKHNFNISFLEKKYNIKPPKYWESPVLKYKNGLCILTFKMPIKNPPLVVFKSNFKKNIEGDSTQFTLYYPVVNLNNDGNLYYQTRFSKDLTDGIYYPGTFAKQWKVGDVTYTNNNLLKYTSTIENRILNRTNNNNRNKTDYNSLSYHGFPIPSNMKFIH